MPFRLVIKQVREPAAAWLPPACAAVVFPASVAVVVLPACAVLPASDMCMLLPPAPAGVGAPYPSGAMSKRTPRLRQGMKKAPPKDA